MQNSGNILKNWFFETNSAKKIKDHAILSFFYSSDSSAAPTAPIQHGFSAQQDTRFEVLSFPDTSVTCCLVFLF
jgi:hypothetical protein